MVFTACTSLVQSFQCSSSAAGDDFYLAVFLLLALALDFVKSGQQDSHSDELLARMNGAEMDTSYVNVLEPPLEADFSLVV